MNAIDELQGLRSEAKMRGDKVAARTLWRVMNYLAQHEETLRQTQDWTPRAPGPAARRLTRPKS